jgi:hypothetical protein
MRQTHFVQRQESFLDVAVNPGFIAIMRPLGAFLDHCAKLGIAGYMKTILPDGLGERFGQMKPIERQDRSILRFDPERLLVFTRVGHREYAVGIGFQQQVNLYGHTRPLSLIAPFASLG